MNNYNCWRVRDPGVTGNHVIYAACGGQCNGDKNDEHCFGGSLFNQQHVCALCRQTDKFVLMHVCKELRPCDDDCFYYHSWRNNVVIAFGTLSSFLTYLQ